MQRPTDHDLLMAAVDAMQVNLTNIYDTLKDLAELMRDLIDEVHNSRLPDTPAEDCVMCSKMDFVEATADSLAANARLVAAAPDLLAAAKGVLGELNCMGLADTPGDTFADLRNRCYELDTAISNAELGRTTI